MPHVVVAVVVGAVAVAAVAAQPFWLDPVDRAGGGSAAQVNEAHSNDGVEG